MIRRTLQNTLLLSLLLISTISCKMEEKEYKIEGAEENKVTNTEDNLKKEEHLPPVTDNPVDDESIKKETFSEVTQNAQYPGGMSAFNRQFVSRFRTPDIETGVERIKVIVQFIIEIDGSITNIIVLRDPGYGTGKEAIRVLNSMPKWIPAELNGEKVRSQFTLPITIQIL